MPRPDADVDNAPVCHECGTLVPQVEELQDALIRTQRQLSATRTQLRKLRLDQSHVDAELMNQALEVAQYWKQLLAPKTRELKGPRVENTYKRLVGDGTDENGGYSVDELKLAVYGYYCRQYVVDGRRSHTGKPNQRYIDLELIMRDAKRVDAGISIARHDAKLDVELAQNGAGTQWATLCDCGHARLHHIRPDLIYHFLVRAYGEEQGEKLWLERSEPCAHAGCACVTFDNVNSLINERIERSRTEPAPPPPSTSSATPQRKVA